MSSPQVYGFSITQPLSIILMLRGVCTTRAPCASLMQVVKDAIWTFEQTQALENFCVYTPVRMTVIRLKTGGLWVHAPVAPTDECVHMLKELGGDVEYIILPTFAYEHKAFVGPFSRKFPKAKVRGKALKSLLSIVEGCSSL